MEIRSFDLEYKDNRDRFEKDLDNPKYIDDVGRTLRVQLQDYMETKSMSYELLDYLREKGDSNELTLMRGDCLYESLVKEGGSFRLWNGFASFTYDEEIAEKFSNTQNIPDWYENEGSWFANRRFPFEEFIERGEPLIPVIIIIEPEQIPRCICTDNVHESFNESEFLVYTEDIEFVIDKVVDNKLYCSTRKIPNMNLWRRWQ